MKALTNILRFSIILAVYLSASAIRSQEFPSPGPEHEFLKRLEGTWNVTISTPSGDTGEGTAKCNADFNGLWRTENLSISIGGESITWRSHFGYDINNKKYLLTWVGSTASTPIFLEGAYDADKKLLMLTGENLNPSGSREKQRLRIHFLDKDRSKCTFWTIAKDGEATEIWSADYVRKR